MSYRMFSDHIDDVVPALQQAGYVDVSCGNDACPSFRRDFAGGFYVQIWVADRREDARECTGGCRAFMQFRHDGNTTDGTPEVCHDLWQGDDGSRPFSPQQLNKG